MMLLLCITHVADSRYDWSSWPPTLVDLSVDSGFTKLVTCLTLVATSSRCAYNLFRRKKFLKKFPPSDRHLGPVQASSPSPPRHPRDVTLQPLCRRPPVDMRRAWVRCVRERLILRHRLHIQGALLSHCRRSPQTTRRPASILFDLWFS